MDTNSYFLELLVEARLAEARARSARYALCQSLAPDRRDALSALGVTLIKAARWLGRRHAVRRRRMNLPTPSLP